MIGKKRVASVLMSVMLGTTMLAACGGEPKGTTGSGDSGEKAPETIVFSMPSFHRIPDDMNRIEDAINKITLEKINVKVDFRVYGVSDYAQKVNLALQSGEQMDLFTSPGQFANFAAKNQLYPLDELLDEYGQDLTNKLNEDFGPDILKTTTLNGQIYGIPANKGMALPINFVYNADMLSEVGMTADDINTVEDLPKVLDAIKEKFPDSVPFGPVNVNPSDTGLIRLLQGMDSVDYLTDTSGVGVVIGDSGKVVNYYETDEFKRGVELMRDWYNKGYLQKDAATTSLTMSEIISSGRGFSFMAGYGGMEAHRAISSQTGKNIAMKRIAPFYFDSGAVNAVVWMISSNTKVPEATMKFANLLYTDEALINTILYGIENEDYVKVDEHHVKYPDGKDASTVGYTAQLSSGIVGSESIQYQLEGVNWSDIELKLRENKETEKSPYFGFIFDQNSVRTEISAINNVVNQYRPGLVTGSLDPETTIPKFIKALNDAGAETIINEKQKQLDAWLAAQ